MSIIYYAYIYQIIQNYTMGNSGTTVRISKKTRLLLEEVGKEIGEFGETYDDIIFKALEKVRKKNEK